MLYYKIGHYSFLLSNFYLFKVRMLEKEALTGFNETFEETKSESVGIGGYNDSESESSDSETGQAIRQPKKLKMTSLHH